MIYVDLKHVPLIENELQLGFLQKFFNLIMNTKSRVIMDAEVIRNRAITSAHNFAKETSRSGVRCRKADLQRMYHIIIETLNREKGEKKL